MFQKLAFLFRRSGRKTLNILVELRRNGYSTSEIQSLLKEVQRTGMKPSDVRKWRKQENTCGAGTLLAPPAPTYSATNGESVSVPITPARPLQPPQFPQVRGLNEARLIHLASLGLDLASKKVLEVGGDRLRAPFWESLKCRLFFADASLETVTETTGRHPCGGAATPDLYRKPVEESEGTFDIVSCFGPLDDLACVRDTVRKAANVCSELLLLETRVNLGNATASCPEEELGASSSAAPSNLENRLSREDVIEMLKAWFPHVYATSTQPAHSEFETDWVNPVSFPVSRCLFVAAKRPLNNPFLLQQLPLKQFPLLRQAGDVWLSVGVPSDPMLWLGAAKESGLTVYAFEPNASLTGPLQGRAANFHGLALAVGDEDGFPAVRLTSSETRHPAPALPQAQTRARKQGSKLPKQKAAVVPMIRLDTFFDKQRIDQADLLEIVDLRNSAAEQVLAGAGDRLADIARISVDEADAVETGHTGPAVDFNKVKRMLTEAGFVQTSADIQEEGPLARAGFAKATRWHRDELCPYVPDEAIADAAARVHSLRTALEPWPEYDLQVGLGMRSPDGQVRRTLWNAARKRRSALPFEGDWLLATRFNHYLGRDLTLATFLAGTFDPNEFCFLHSIIKPGMRIIDVGANEGLYAIFFAAAVGPSGMVVALEPSQREAQRLEANVRLNRFDNRVRICHKAASDRPGLASFKVAGFGHEGQNTLGDFFWDLPTSDGVVEVACSPLDDLPEISDLEPISVIKIDAEGAEFKVMKGARRLIERDRPVVLFEVNEAALARQNASRSDLYQFFASFGYSLYGISSRTGQPVPVDEGCLAGENIIASPCPLQNLSPQSA